MTAKNPWLKSDGLLLVTAIIWGFAFAAQRKGMDDIGPFAYGAVRFAIGALCMVPFIPAVRKRFSAGAAAALPSTVPASRKALWSAGAGLVLFAGSSLQQIGIVYTTAGNAGFITCLYVVIVPLMGVVAGRRIGPRIWAGALLAITGLYLLSIREGFRMAPGDLYVLAGSFFWALHIIVVGKLAGRMGSAELGFGQYVVCSVLSLVAALVREPRPFAGTGAAIVPILYGGLFSIGIAYTLQIVAQKTAHPAHASIILSMESLFAAIGGALILGERIDARTAAGGILMFAGMIVSQTTRRDAGESPVPERSRS